MGDEAGIMDVLVTGGGGFVGSALVRRLVESGCRVTSFSRGDYPDLRKLGVTVIRGDLNNRFEVLKAAEGRSVVFHTAALAGFWGKPEDYQKANVLGTHHIIEACLKNGVDKLIYTSTASTVFQGPGIVNGGQDLGYPERPLNDYCRTKALAEQAVLKANGPSLKTISLRPHIVTGPGDNHLIPRLISRAGSGRLRIIGNGKNIIDTVFIDNLIDAHMLAIRALGDNPGCRGKAYFITNGEPVNLWDFINLILEGAGHPAVRKRIPYRMALPLSSMLSGIHKLIPSLGEPLLTPFLVRELAQSHWFDPEPARRDLGYSPTVSTREGLEILIMHLKKAGTTDF